MAYFGLLLFFVALLVLNVFFIKKKLFSPSVLFILSYLVMTVFATIGLLSWNTQKEISLYTMCVVSVSTLAFCGGDFFASKIKIKNRKIPKNYSIEGERKIKKIVYLAGIILYAVVAMFMVRDINAVCAKYSCSATNLSEKIYYFRLRSDLFSNESESFSFITKTLLSMVEILAIYYCYIFIQNMKKKERIRENLKNLLPPLLYIAISLLQSGRAGSMKLIVAALVIFFFIYGREIASTKQLNLLKRFIPVGIVVLLLFYFSLALIGRESKIGLLDYVSAAFGCSLPSLDIALNSNISQHAATPLVNSLRGLGGFVEYLGIELPSVAVSLPFIDIGGFRSNTFTSSFRLLDDFGFGIMAIAMLFAGFFYGLICNSLIKNKDNRTLVLYASLCPRIIDMFRDDTFYTIVLSPGTIKVLLIVLIVGKVLFVNGQKAKEKRH